MCSMVHFGEGKKEKKASNVLVLESSWHTAQLKFSLVFTK